MKKYLLALLVLLSSTSAMANAIFPAFASPYVVPAFFPLALIAVLCIETIIYKLASKKTPIFQVFLLAGVANGASWITGFIISFFLPSGHISVGDQAFIMGPDFKLYASWGYVIAYVLSVIIEGFVVKASVKKMHFNSPFPLSFYANSASYSALVVLLWSQELMPI